MIFLFFKQLLTNVFYRRRGAYTSEAFLKRVAATLTVCFATFPSALPAQDFLNEAASDGENIEYTPPLEGSVPPEDASSDPTADTSAYIIKNVECNITGETREWALLYKSGIKTGDIITGSRNLAEYIHMAEQKVLNTRVLESAEITYTTGESEDGLIPVYLNIKTVDSSNFIGFPAPEYSSSEGLDLKIKLRDYNFLGTMEPLRFDLGYALTDEDWGSFSKGTFSFSIDSAMPFNLFGLRWNFHFDQNLAYTYKNPFYYKGILGLSVEVPVKRASLTLGLEQSIVVNEENHEAYWPDFGQFTQLYLTTALNSALTLPTGIHVGSFGELSYTPSFTAKVHYRFGKLPDFRKGVELTFAQSLGFGRIDWLGNFRNGLEGALTNTNDYNTRRNDWKVNYEAALRGHKNISSFFGVSGQVSFSHWFFTNRYLGGRYPVYTEVGARLRGIEDDSLIAENNSAMLLLNAEFPFRVWRFDPPGKSEKSKIRYFHFDLHIAPFFDAAFFKGKKDVLWSGGRYAAWQDKDFFSTPLMTAGAEVILYPLAWRSFYIRFSIGYNINKIAQTRKMPFYDEIFIGTGHHF